MLALLLAALSFADCPAPTFEFVGQPDCVELEFDGERTTLTNACDAPLLIDQSVHLGQGQVVPARTSTKIRDLSAFTVGYEGALHRVVAVFAEPEVCEEEVEGLAATEETTDDVDS